jgi:hypothetical protein
MKDQKEKIYNKKIRKDKKGSKNKLEIKKTNKHDKILPVVDTKITLKKEFEKFK